LFGLKKNALRNPSQAIQLLEFPLLFTAMAALGRAIGRLWVEAVCKDFSLAA
jgi:hypothetical protein